MDYITTRQSISYKILNEDTGELENKKFNEEKKKKTIKGGFNMIYHKNYEEIMEEVINSNKELKLFNWIINNFTYDIKEAYISYPGSEIISKTQYTKMIKKLLELNFLYKVKRSVYRLNPFIYLPYRANAEELQQEWRELTINTN